MRSDPFLFSTIVIRVHPLGYFLNFDDYAKRLFLVQLGFEAFP